MARGAHSPGYFEYKKKKSQKEGQANLPPARPLLAPGLDPPMSWLHDNNETVYRQMQSAGNIAKTMTFRTGSHFDISISISRHTQTQYDVDN